jgi:hypothetical protein
MPRTEVETGSVTVAGNVQGEMAQRLRTMAGQAANLGGGAVGAAGDPQAVQTLAQACSNWSSALTALGDGMDCVARNTHAASGAYSITDHTQMGGG